MIYAYQGKKPKIHESAYIAPGAQIIGDVTIGKEASIWFNCVIRADNAPIIIGERVNVQDGSVLHADPGIPLTLEDEVSIGHSAILHGCTIGRGALVGMGATVLNHAEIGEYALVGANSLITEGKKIPPRTLAVGSPVKVVRELTESDLARLSSPTKSYLEKIKLYKEDGIVDL